MDRLTFAGPKSRWRYLGLLPLALLIAGPKAFATVMSGVTSLIVAPFTGTIEFSSSRYEIFNVELLLVYVIVVLSLNIVFQNGMISLGHSAFFLVGAYTTALLTTRADWSFWLALLMGVVLSAALGFMLGAPAIRLGLFTLAMVSMGYALVAEDMVTEWRSITGGGDGLSGIQRPAPFGELETYYWLIAIFAILVFFFTRNWLRSSFGRAGKATADNEVAAGSIGIDVRVTKVRSFVVSAALAGLGGGLYAPLIGFISPAAFTVDLAVLFLLMVLLGGGGTVIGPVIGAVILFRIPLAVEDITGAAGNISLLVYGVVLVISVRLMPQGFMSAWWFIRDRWLAKYKVQTMIDELKVDESAAHFDTLLAAASLEGSELRAAGMRKQLGGVKAVDGIDIAVLPEQVHALIGPNGSGKTTTLNLLSGYMESDYGEFTLNGENVPARGYVRARYGLGRTFQTPLLFGSMSCVENVLVALDRKHSENPIATLLRLPTARRNEHEKYQRALDILAAVGITDPDTQASVLTPGRRRLLEIARLVASEPAVVLMDEPAAGLTSAEIEHLETMVRSLAAAGVGIILVEHHVDFVLAVADVVTVLDFGKVIAHGSPQEVRQDPVVMKAYLGAMPDTAEGQD